MSDEHPGGQIDTQPTDETADLATNGSGLEWREKIRGRHPGDQYVRINTHPAFNRIRPGIIAPRPGEAEAATRPGRFIARVKHAILGTPIPSSAEMESRVDIPRGLAIFASDNISSSAYATEELMRVLALAGIAALSFTLPITLAIIVVLAIVIVSYLQVISAYPDGGGSYVVARENLGPLAGLVAAAALLTDYILTVAVSVSAGVAAMTSAFPELAGIRVQFALGVIALMTLVNLRGIRESGTIFAVPTYLYLVSVLGLLAVGMFRYAVGDLPDYNPPAEWVEASGTETVGLLLVLRAFASGSVALTGTEAVSNGVPAFRPPEVRNSQITLIIMGTLFATIMLGFSLLASALEIVPDPHEVQTVISILARNIVGENIFFYTVQFSTALVLVLAGNTAFNGFPMLASILAKDGNLPRQFSYRGDRLAFTGGILFLAGIAGMLVWIYEARVAELIPLYTVGVFLAFTLSQSGLVRLWWRSRETVSYWRFRLASNALGAAVTGIVAVVVGVSKFLLGAWMVLLLIPLLVWVMWHINQHYRRVREAEREPVASIVPERATIRAIVPIANLRAPALQAVTYALSITDPSNVTILHVTDDPQVEERIRAERRRLDLPGQLVVIESPYRSLLGPLVTYIDAVQEIHPHDMITVVLPEYVPRHWWEHLLHNQTALRIKAALLFHPNIVVVNVPYHLPA